MFEVGWTGPHTPKFNVGFRAVSCTDMPLTHHEKETDRLFVNGPTGQANFRALTALEGERPTQPQKRQRPSKYIVPKVENFKRSKAGSRLVRQEVLKLVDEQARLCPGKVMRTIDGKNVRYSSSGRVESIALDVLLEKAPGFFSSFFGGSWSTEQRCKNGCPQTLGFAFLDVHFWSALKVQSSAFRIL